ncbi:hypothetical protein PFY12_14505 [Chryseobacterium camelliae]|uniref:DUF3298 domain-containing protein n=1 Tax=Chryseobacterium camelliae TaxID=1265445 RepID=A0ABY7QNE8_9FLAO|nr:hypothetical protein [Chryseobacterium camelliae]WBV60236.1 hypothetical protein PFY12_14505 [Chryseobacterium camelliae]
MMTTILNNLYQIKIRAAVETVFNNKLLEDWNFTRTDEKFLFEKDHYQISVEFEAIYFFNPNGDSYKINNPFFLSEFKVTLEKFLI